MTEAAAGAIEGNRGDVVVFNPNGSSAESLVVLNGLSDQTRALKTEGKTFSVQKTEDGWIAMAILKLYSICTFIRISIVLIFEMKLTGQKTTFF